MGTFDAVSLNRKTLGTLLDWRQLGTSNENTTKIFIRALIQLLFYHEIEKALAIPQVQLRSEKFKNNGDVLPFISFIILILIEKSFRK